ncbi:MAG: hypothetical protein H6510_01080 [Acidobacteria bacterium]|nr:hypothetical protein [Acidobacteriota bacterium]
MRILAVLIVGGALWGQITGVVRDANTLQAVPDAIIVIKGHSMQTTSASDGSFSLNDTASLPFYLVVAKHPYFTEPVFISTVSQSQNMMIDLTPVPLETSMPNGALNTPEDCETCHPDTYTEWLGSPMQKTGLNRWVWDVWDGTGTAGGMNGFVYKRDSIHRFANPNSDCSACHSPVHWLTDIETAGMGDDVNNPTADMSRGVQCEVCHRAAFVDPAKSNFPGVTPESFSFFRNIDVYAEFGLRPDVTYSGGIMRAAYNPQLSAELCAACHEDNTDHDDDGDFEDAGSVPHETTFSEWKTYFLAAAGSGKTCIECHMPLTERDAFCVFEKGRSGTVRTHHIRGTSPAFLDSAVNLDVNASESLSEYVLDIDLTNIGAGHSVPSGVVIRNMLLLVRVRDGLGQDATLLAGDTLDPVAGVGDPNQGYYAGLAGKAFYLNMSDGATERLFYTEANQLAFDSRLKAGESYQNQFRFQMPSQLAGGLQVDVKVLYRRSFRELLDQKGWTMTGHGEPLADIAAPDYGHVMAEYTQSLNPCADRDLDNNSLVNGLDLAILVDQWLSPPPFGGGAKTGMMHLAALVNCLP